MNVRLFSIVIAGLCAGQAFAETPPLDEGTRRFLDMVNRPILIEPSPPPKVREQKNRVYRRDVPGSVADIYMPAKPGRPVAVVVLVHGGVGADLPLRPKDWGSYQSWGRLLASEGFVAVTYNHRLGYPAPMIEEAASDLDSLMAFVRAGAKSWGADPERVAIAVYSAGGMLLASALREPRSGLKSVVAFYPIVDLTVATHLKAQLSAEQLERHTLGSQLAAIAGRMPPLLLVRAGRDQIPDLLPGLDRFIAEATRTNAPVAVINHPEGEHGFDSKEATPMSVTILRLALAFLKETTRG